MNATVAKIQKLQGELNGCVIERESQIEASLAAIIAGVHVLLLGPPGTAKSMLTDLLCKSISSANYFQWLLTKFSTPEELFGPISMKGLENDQYKRITTGKLPQAHVAFVDEIFKANSAILNSLLTLINERRFHNNGGAETVPLLSCFGASNELPQGEELGALYDRFILRFWVEPIQDDKAFCDLLSGSLPAAPTTKLTLDEIKELRAEMGKVEVKREFLETIREIMHELQRKGIVASDRRWKNAIQVLRAFALLRGEQEVGSDELELLADMLWDRPEDRKAILEVVSPRANPLNLVAIKLLDSAKEIYENWKKGTGDKDASALMANGSLREILKSIDENSKDRPAGKTKKLLEARVKVEAFRKEVVISLGV